MKILLSVLLTLLIGAGNALAQRKSPPRFQDFPVVEKFKAKPARLNLQSHPHARVFRTMLRDTAKQGANFAGHYAVNYWGCGSDCLRIGIVDLRTGRAYVSPFYASIGIEAHPDSRLLVVAPPEQIKEIYDDNAVPAYIHPRYYEWDGRRLVLIYPAADKSKGIEVYWR